MKFTIKSSRRRYFHPGRFPLSLTLVIAAVLLLPAFFSSGCSTVQADMPWAAPAMEPDTGAGQEVQALLDSYANALVDKDREGFLSTIDPTATSFLSNREELFGRLEAVPLDRYDVQLDSISESGGDAVAKVSISFNLKGSFTDLSDPWREAFLISQTADGWKLAGDATAATLGKERDALLEDFGKVRIMTTDHAIVLYLDGGDDVARRAGEFVDAAWPELTTVLPADESLKVPLRVFNNHEQIDAAFPGQWQEWVGGASRKLGQSENAGGEIILDAELFRRSDAQTPDYNRKMLAHELTHVFMFPFSGIKTPPFLVEGLADYVAGLESAPMLAGKLNRGEAISPTLADLYRPAGFDVLLTDEAAQLAYEESDTAVAYLIQTYGDQKVLELMREFKRREDEDTAQDQLVNEVFQSVTGMSWNDFELGWRAYVQEQ